MAKMTNDEIVMAVRSARINKELIELQEKHKEKYSCVLTPFWEDHFRGYTRNIIASQETLNDQISRLKRELKQANEALDEAKRDGASFSLALFSKPPQGYFPFQGRLVAVRGTGNCVLIDDEDHTIPESWRPMSTEERALMSRIDDDARAALQGDFWMVPSETPKDEDEGGEVDEDTGTGDDEPEAGDDNPGDDEELPPDSDDDDTPFIN